VLDDLVARQPGHGEPALADQQHAPLPGVATAAAKAAASAGRRTPRSNGSRASNVDPSSAVPSSAPSRARTSWAVAGLEVRHPALDAAPGTEHRHVLHDVVLQVTTRHSHRCQDGRMPTTTLPRPVETWLTDMDGVLVHEEDPIPGRRSSSRR
jgi:hypothetical protein